MKKIDFKCNYCGKTQSFTNRNAFYCCTLPIPSQRVMVNAFMSGIGRTKQEVIDKLVCDTVDGFECTKCGDFYLIEDCAKKCCAQCTNKNMNAGYHINTEIIREDSSFERMEKALKGGGTGGATITLEMVEGVQRNE